MKNFLASFGLRFTTGHALWAAALIPACIALFLHLDRLWIGITLAVIIALAAVLTDARPTAHRLDRGGVLVASATPQARPTCRRSRPSVRR